MYAPRIQILNIKAFENEFREERYIMIYIFHSCSAEVPAYVSRERLKRKFRRRLKKAAIYAASTSKPALSTKYSEYADVFFKNKINNIPSVTRTDHAINFEKNSIISYKFIYYFSKRELIVLK
jgi:hypothetical protein